MVIWLIGKSGAGKSEIGIILYDKLKYKYPLVLCSEKENPFLRLFDMLKTYLFNIPMNLIKYTKM